MQDQDKPNFFGKMGSALFNLGGTSKVKAVEDQANEIKMDAYGYTQPESMGLFQSSQNLKELQRGNSR